MLTTTAVRVAGSAECVVTESSRNARSPLTSPTGSRPATRVRPHFVPLPNNEQRLKGTGYDPALLSSRASSSGFGGYSQPFDVKQPLLIAVDGVPAGGLVWRSFPSIDRRA